VVFDSKAGEWSSITLNFGDGRTLPLSGVEFIPEPCEAVALERVESRTIEFECTIEGDALAHFLGAQGDDPRTLRDLEGKWLW